MITKEPIVMSGNRPTGRFRYYEDNVLFEKDCNRCLKRIAISEYDYHPKNGDRLQPDCKDCARERRRAAYKKRKAEDPTYQEDSNRVRAEKNRSRTPAEVALKRAELRPDGLKRCESCGLRQKFEAFCMDSIQTDGLRRICRLCAGGKWFDWKVKPYLDHWKSLDIPLECYVCGGPYEHSDHVIPESLGGPDDPENRLPMCAHHNTSKNGTPLLKWLHENHPDDSQAVIQRVLDYGVDPFTSKDLMVKIA